jgi:uncharacterized protein (TIGR02186 family)
MARLFALLLLLLPASLSAEEIVLGLSRDEVAITATFDGSDILIFGAIRRDGTATLEGNLGIIVTVAGPDKPITVRRKERRLGIWINVESVEIDVAPSFYAVATNAPMSEILAPSEDAATRISISRAIRSVGRSETGSAKFTEALMRIRAANGLYQDLEGAVSVDEETLFRTSIGLPSNLTEGNYTTEIYLTRGGQIVDLYSAIIPVKKVGLEQFLYRLAHDQPIIYGLMSLAIAIAAGWIASAVFGMIRR